MVTTRGPRGEVPCYVISVAARMVGLSAQTLRSFERAGLVEPSRSEGNIRLYSPSDVERIRRIRTLMNDMGVNLAGVEVILNLMEHIKELEEQLQSPEREVHARQGPKGGRARARSARESS